jgi:hypothetical protein
MAQMPATLLSRRFVYVLACLLPVWAVIAFFTGGVGWMLGPIRLSSRQPLRPLIIGLIIAGVYVWKYSRAERDADGRWLHRWAVRTLPFTVPLAAMLALYIGIHYGSFAAAGADSYGYVSQARFWLDGIPRIQQPWVLDFPWENRDWIFSPLGYRPFSPDGTIVPGYPSGLPLIMAAFLGVFGANGPFYVVPVLAALTVWFTYMLGREATGSRTVGALAAGLLVASPTFLTHVMVPMSDVPAAAGWTLVAVLALKQKPLAAGVVSGLSLMIRPNLILLTLVPALAWRGRKEPLIRFATGLVPGLMIIMIVNMLLYGGPLTTGYASLFDLYAFGALPLNLRNYVLWLLETQTPLILLALVPFFVRDALHNDGRSVSPRACLAALIGLTLASYVFYATFDHWFYLRFLLPAYPGLLVLMVAALRWLAWKIPTEARVPAVAAICAALIPFGVNVARHDGVFNVAVSEGRYIRAAQEVASRTPPDAIVMAAQHSGSVRYYADRITLRYDLLKDVPLDTAMQDLAAKGRRVYLVVEDWEEKEFRARFSPSNRAAQLGDPIARVPSSPEVRIFELQAGGPAPIP